MAHVEVMRFPRGLKFKRLVVVGDLKSSTPMARFRLNRVTIRLMRTQNTLNPFDTLHNREAKKPCTITVIKVSNKTRDGALRGRGPCKRRVVAKFVTRSQYMI